MNTEDRFYDWSREQWAWGADYLLTCGEVLPPENDLVRAFDVQDFWTARRLDVPGPSLILGIDVLGRELPPRQPRAEAARWARRLFAYARQAELHRQIEQSRIPGWALKP